MLRASDYQDMERRGWQRCKELRGWARYGTLTLPSGVTLYYTEYNSYEDGYSRMTGHLTELGLSGMLAKMRSA